MQLLTEKCTLLLYASKPALLKFNNICVFLGCDLLIQLLLKSLLSVYDDSLEDCFHHVPICSCTMKYIAFYPITNRLTRFLPVICQYSCFFV